MIHVQVQFEYAGDLYTYMAPEAIDHGDRVIAMRDGVLEMGHIVAVGSTDSGPAEEIIRVLRPGERPEEIEEPGDASDTR